MREKVRQVLLLEDAEAQDKVGQAPAVALERAIAAMIETEDT